MRYRIALLMVALSACALSVGPASAQNGELPYIPYTFSPAAYLGQPQPKDKNGNGDKKDDDSGNGKKNGDDKDKDKKDDEPTWYSVHGQATTVTQGNFRFHSPYQGTNSYVYDNSLANSVTATLFLAARVWDGGEIIFNPEIAGGRGLSAVFGIADFPNAEITRVGILEPTPYIARLFFRQTFGLGGEQEKIEDGPNAVAGTRDVNRLTIAFGKLPSTDSFDNNRYSDTRTKFLNWGFYYNVAWDYPANVRGYNYGISIDYNTKWWAVRYGVFAMSAVANGADFDPHFLNANGHILEFERRYEWNNQPGAVKFGPYLNLANMGNYREALALSPVNPDVTATRQSRIRYGFILNWQQQLSDQCGVFARAGWNNGQAESWEYTEADVSGSCGVVFKGKHWDRPQDEVGVAYVLTGLSAAHRDYLAAGGLGFELGDGKLNYGLESVFEIYYNCELRKGMNLTFDYQVRSSSRPSAGSPAWTRTSSSAPISAASAI
jgi:high affinity Mn2+ porin